MLEYKKEMRTQEVLQLEKKVDVAKEQLSQNEKTIFSLKAEISKEEQELQSIKTKKTKIKKVDDIAAKPTLLDGGKVVVAKEEFENVKILAKKQIAAESKEQRLLAENVALKEENRALNHANEGLTKGLNQHRSVKNRLSMADVEAELSNVKKLLSKVLEFVEKLGLKAQLEKFLNQKIDKVKNR